jgi:hypothetical protein
VQSSRCALQYYAFDCVARLKEIQRKREKRSKKEQWKNGKCKKQDTNKKRRDAKK